MLNNKQLNILAVQAKQGCKDSIGELCRHYLPYIEKVSVAVWYKLDSETSFECRCIRRIQNALKKFDPDIGDFDSRVRLKIRQEVGRHIRRGSKKRSNLVSSEWLEENEEGKSVLYLEDSKANISDKVLTKEIIALLAQDDEKKKFVLNCWSDGLYNDSEIAKLVAERYGVNPKSYRITIQRFRESCKVVLSSQL